MATEDNALTPQEQAKLKAFAQGLPDNPSEIDVDAIAQQTGTSRRQVLQVIAAVGVGSIAGGVSVSQLVAEAQAQASTSDSDGNVGTPADRVDVFADGVDASVIDTDQGTIAGSKEIPGVPSSSTSVTPGFGSFTQASSTRPVLLEIEARVETDGTTDADIFITVDESGGTTPDYFLHLAFADSDAGSGHSVRQTSSIMLPVGAQYRLLNNSDPNNANQINDIRKFVL